METKVMQPLIQRSIEAEKRGGRKANVSASSIVRELVEAAREAERKGKAK